MVAALENGVTGDTWFSVIDTGYRPATLQAAWRKVAANAGAAGVDRQSVEPCAARAEVSRGELEAALKAGRDEPLAVVRVESPKGPGTVRPLGIPAVKDRIVQTAVKLVLEPIFECACLETSSGCRPGRGCTEALREGDRLLKAGYTQVVDADLASDFDTIPHAPLMARVGERVSDGRVRQVIEAFLHQDIVKGMQRWTPTGGTPQGAVISPVLANLYLHPLDCAMRESGYQMVRDADDVVVLCQTAEEARAGLADVQAWMQANGLTLNPDKTHVGDCREEGQGFDCLGYRFEAGQRSRAAQESDSDTRSDPGQDRAHSRGQSRLHHCGIEPDAPRLVRLLSARASVDLQRHGRLRSATVALAAAQAAEASRDRAHAGRPSPLAQCVLC